MLYVASQMSEKMLKFIKLGQQNPPKREVLERKEDFKEIYNEFINQKLLDKVSFIISDEVIEVDSNKIHIVDDSKMFIKNLAIEFRKFSKSNFIGITGTNGKTSTKETIAN